MTDLPPEAPGRLASRAFSSGLSVADFAACLQMGMRPVALVQGFCAMRWSWYGPGSMYTMSGYGGRSSWGTTLSSYRCPHGYVGAEHRVWGENFEQRWIRQAWHQGFDTAYQRMVEEARAAGAHGVIGVVDTSRSLVDRSIREFHIYGTAVVVDGSPAGPVWTSYLAGSRLAKLIESGFMPVAVVASMASVRMWAVCVTEYLMKGQSYGYGSVSGYPPGAYGGSGGEIGQMADAQMQARRVARDHARYDLGRDTLHGASLDVGQWEVGPGDLEVDCILRGTRVRRFRPADPLPPPRLTVPLT
ncbi:MAG TPA: heavy metal-binding domain-containing protein [Acidimicrobiales bacterium]|nr:heavy metal-binding domain-containing protein [Acidimicrobiales bacterium]